MSSPVALLFDRFGPYHAARIAAAAAAFPTIAVEFGAETSAYAWERVDTPDSFQRHTVVSEGCGDALPTFQFAKRLFAILDRAAPGLVAIPGWAHRGAHLALAWALRAKVPALLMSDSQYEDEDRNPLKELAKSRVVRLCSAALVGGSRHADYARRLGANSSNIFVGYDVVDNEHFSRGAQVARASARVLRRRLQLPENFFLASSRFIAKKNISGLLRGYARYRRAAGQTAWGLVVLGDGALKDQIHQVRRDLALENEVLLPGFQQYEDLPNYYGLAGAFVHTSTTEQWGLVINEAMAAGLAVIVSRRCGCVPELVEEGANGFTFDPHDEDGLARALTFVATRDFDRRQMGLRSREIIARWSPQTFAMQLGRARAAALETKLPIARPLDWAVLGALALK